MTKAQPICPKHGAKTYKVFASTSMWVCATCKRDYNREQNRKKRRAMGMRPRYPRPFAVICPTHGQKRGNHRRGYFCRKRRPSAPPCTNEQHQWRKQSSGWRYCYTCFYERYGASIRARNKERSKTPEGKEQRKKIKAMRRGANQGYWVTQRDIRRLYHRQRQSCFWCGTRIAFDQAQRDHVIPVAKGGIHSIGNLVLACARCNTSKGAKLPIVWRTQHAQAA